MEPNNKLKFTLSNVQHFVFSIAVIVAARGVLSINANSPK
jgi:hypothetical protein